MCLILINSSCGLLNQLIQGVSKNKESNLKDEYFSRDGMNFLKQEVRDTQESRFHLLVILALEKSLMGMVFSYAIRFGANLPLHLFTLVEQVF